MVGGRPGRWRKPPECRYAWAILQPVPVGVFGKSAGGHGGYFESNAAYGVLDFTTASGFAGCTSVATVANTAAFAGGTSTVDAYAAIFNGFTVVNG